MADSRGSDPVDGSRGLKPPRDLAGAAPDKQSPAPAGRPCPECSNPSQILVSEGDMVAIYRCPICGHLSAPLKER